MLRTLILSAAFVMMAVSVPAADVDAFAGVKGSLDIAGGTAHIPVMKNAARIIMTAYPDIRITVAGGGSGTGVRMVGEGLAQIGNTGRPLTAGETEKYGLATFPFAIDGVAAVVHPANPLSELSRGQLADIFAGRVVNWREVGGDDAAISLYIREDGSGTREVFEAEALKGGDVSTGANVMASNGAMKIAVARDPNAIGYVGIGHLDGSVKGVVVDGMVPSQPNAADGSYDIVRLLFMNTKGRPEGLTALFIDFLYSGSGTECIEKAGYIPTGR